MSTTLKCGCGAGFTSSANLKRHQKLCKKPIVAETDSDNSDAVSVHSEASTSSLQLTKVSQLKPQLNRIEAKLDLVLKHKNIDITSIVQPKASPKFKITSSKPSITFEELCMKDFATAKNAVRLTHYSCMGCDGIVSLFKDILKKYKLPPFKYINIPTKKTQKDAECIIHKFEDNISIYKDKSWTPMTRDDTNDLFYNLYIALENNYPLYQEDDKEYNEELHRLYNDVDELNIYSMVVVNIKDKLIEAIKSIC